MKLKAAARRTIGSAGGCLFFLAALFSSVVPALASPAVELESETLPDGGQYIDARIRTAADRDVIWEVLTDYEALPRFVSSLKSSRLDPSAAPLTIVEQEGTGRFLFMSRTAFVRLLIEETPQTEIFFRDLSGRDFRSYGGRWTIQPVEGRTPGFLVGYELEAHPRLGAPPFVKKGVLKRTVRALLEEVRAEIERRQAGRSVAAPKSEEVPP